MRRFLLDTNAASKCLARRYGVFEKVREALRRGDRVGLPIPVVGELFAGVELSAARDRNRERLLRATRAFVLWPFDLRASEEYGRVFAVLRKAGRPIPQIDIQIAAVALSLGNCTVVSSDSDLRSVSRLDVQNWTERSSHS